VFLHVICIPEPLRDRSEPGLATKLFYTPDQVGVGKVVQAAVDLTDYTNQGFVPSVIRWNIFESGPDLSHGISEQTQFLFQVQVATLDNFADIVQAFLVSPVSVARVGFVGPRLQQQLSYRVSCKQRPPSKPGHIAGINPCPLVSICAGG